MVSLYRKTTRMLNNKTKYIYGLKYYCSRIQCRKIHKSLH